jgi:CheY-like chemotaxis protein
VAANRILVVEDEALIRMLLEDMLDDLGCTLCGSAGRYEEAEALAQSAECDLAILDVSLDGKEIYPVTTILERRDIPYIFVTGHGRDGLPEAFREKPMLQKPFQIDDLRDLLAATLQSAA